MHVHVSARQLCTKAQQAIYGHHFVQQHTYQSIRADGQTDPLLQPDWLPVVHESPAFLEQFAVVK